LAIAGQGCFLSVGKCGDPSILRKIKDLSYGITFKTYWFVLLSELMHFKADALLRSHSKKVTLKELLEKG
jgi:hypothetical protein